MGLPRYLPVQNPLRCRYAVCRLLEAAKTITGVSADRPRSYARPGRRPPQRVTAAKPGRARRCRINLFRRSLFPLPLLESAALPALFDLSGLLRLFLARYRGQNHPARRARHRRMSIDGAADLGRVAMNSPEMRGRQAYTRSTAIRTSSAGIATPGSSSFQLLAFIPTPPRERLVTTEGSHITPVQHRLSRHKTTRAPTTAPRAATLSVLCLPAAKGVKRRRVGQHQTRET